MTLGDSSTSRGSRASPFVSAPTSSRSLQVASVRRRQTIHPLAEQVVARYT